MKNRLILMFVRLGSSLKRNVLYRSSIFSSGFAGSFYGNPLPRSLGYRLNHRVRSLVVSGSLGDNNWI